MASSSNFFALRLKDVKTEEQAVAGKQGGSEQDPTGPNKDEYLMNLFRREDMGYTNPQPSMFAQGSQSAVPSQSGQPGLNVGQSQPFTAFSAVNLPNYPGCGMLSRYGAHIVLPQQQQPQQQQQQRVPGLPVYSSDKVCSGVFHFCVSLWHGSLHFDVLVLSPTPPAMGGQTRPQCHCARTCADSDHRNLCHMAGHKQDGPAGVR